MSKLLCNVLKISGGNVPNAPLLVALLVAYAPWRLTILETQVCAEYDVVRLHRTEVLSFSCGLSDAKHRHW